MDMIRLSNPLFSVQGEYAGRLSKVEAERQTLAETVAAVERRGGEEKLRVDDLQQQLKSAKAAAETAKQELQDYKHKASRILQVRKTCCLFRLWFDSPRIIFIRLLLTNLTCVDHVWNDSLVQRKVDQQSEGGIWSGHSGRQRRHGYGAGGSASWEGNAEGGDPKTTGASAHTSDRNTGEIL